MSTIETFAPVTRDTATETRSDETSLNLVSAVRLLAQLMRHRRLIIAVTGIAALTGYLSSFLFPDRFTATTTILTPQQSQSSVSMLMSQVAGTQAGQLASLAGGGLGLRNPSDLYIALLGSRPVADALIAKFQLQSVYHSRDMTDARKKLSTNTKIVAEKSGLILVSVTDRDRDRSAAMANAYTNQLRALTRSLAVSEASQRRLFYDEQLRYAKEDLVTAEFAYQQVQQSKGLVQLDAQAKAMIEGLASLRAQIAAKQVQVQAIRSYSTDRNPEFQLAERELVSLEAEASKLEQRSNGSGFGILGLKDVPSAGLEYLHAQHELAYRQTLYDLLIKQYDAARLDESKEGAVIQVVEPAITPERRSSPQRLLIVILFATMGILGAGAWLLLRTQFQENPELSAAVADLKSTSLSN